MPELATLSETSQIAPAPRLLVELPSRRRVFFENLRDLVSPQRLPELTLRSAPAPFWHDVFVKRGLPWLGFLESIAYHTIALTLLVSLVRFLALHPEPIPRPVFDPHTQVIYYDASEYLPSIDTRSTPALEHAKADPEYSRQPIISVPPEADNRSQTIVTPPNVKLKRDVALPNIVAWADKPQTPRLEIPPAPLTMAAELTRISPRMENSVVAPPPDASHLAHRTSQPNLQAAVVAPPPDLQKSREPGALAPQPAIVAPPPALDNTSTRQLGELNIGRSSVIAPAPQLPVAEQRAVVSGRGSGGIAPQVVPPPPSVSGSGSGTAGQAGSPGRVIALNLHPDVGAPPVAPEGNRRGAFAATPEGHAGASGSPGASSGSASGADSHSSDSRRNGTGNGVGSNSKGKNDLPAGLYVGNPAPGAKASSIAGNSSAKTSTADPVPSSIPKPHGSGAPAHPASPESVAKLSEPERAVFGVRGFYALTVNMPNLNSAGGSWVIRFAELKQDPAVSAGSVTEPVATHMVDPGYPSQLIHENVSGTVIVYGVIHADGTVGDVRVLRTVEDRLDRYACNAVAQWKFQPATKNGTPIDVEATFQIPFRPPKLGTSF